MYIKITDNKIIYPEINMDVILDEKEYLEYLKDNGFVNIPNYEIEYIKTRLEKLNDNAFVLL